ncbi:hypothetical protein N7476_011285 [Penicillium atrosanguineum]|uniref:C2H2-type domain-containing protein n=1 Tax=Penicillium atrosanguineum TaxID=1132637 RepID=A0A9W9PNQ2_9EURO|nr:hypothetical protein N7476_011285 [Penicillium atrosanguineum]
MPPFDMNHGFNYPESSESSEQCYDQSHHAQTASSVTSYTPMNLYRVDYLPYDMMSSTGPVDPQDTMLQGITGGGSSINTAMLANLGSKNMEEDLSAASNSLGRNDETSALIGLTRAEARVSQPPTGDPGPGQTLREFNIDYCKVLFDEECSQDAVRQAKQKWVLLGDHLDAFQRRQNSSTVPPDHTPPSSTKSSTVNRYKCPECDKCDTNNRGIFTRHVNDMHHPKCQFICSEHSCPFQRPRKHQLKDHIQLRHKRVATEEELEACRRDNACPPLCPFCFVNTSSWKDFDKCYLLHCSYGTGISSRRTSVDQGTVGKEDTLNTDQSQPGPSPAPVQAPSRSTNTPGAVGYHHSVFGGNGPTPHPTVPPSSSSSPFRGNAGPNYPPGNAKHRPNTGQPTPGPRRPHHQSGLPNRSAQNLEQRSYRQGSGLSCRRCSHKFNNCPTCHSSNKSTRFCHKCPDFLMILARATANHEQQMGGPPQGVPNFIDPTVTLLNQGHQAQPSPNQAMQGQYPSGTTYFRVPDYNPNGGMGPGFDGQQRNYRTMPVLGLDEPVFSESEMVWPSALDIKTTSLSGSLLKMLPMIDLDPFKKWLCKPLQGLGSLALSGLDFVTQFDPPSSKIAMVNPDCQCKCACRAKARAELASGRKVEMKFKLRPVYRGTSHLRSRVEIVVKLLKLRSSVTESKAKREEAKSAIAQAFEPTLGDRAEEITNYDSDVSDESDAESVFDEDEDDTDALSTSSSYADLQTLVSTKSSSSTSPVDSSDNSLLHFSDGESEENNDGDILIEFNFDLGAALSKLEKWTGGSSMDMFSDMCTSDPGRLFEYLTAYILYVIMSLAHSQDHGSLRRLDN